MLVHLLEGFPRRGRDVVSDTGDLLSECRESTGWELDLRSTVSRFRGGGSGGVGTFCVGGEGDLLRWL